MDSNTVLSQIFIFLQKALPLEIENVVQQTHVVLPLEII